MTTTNIICRVGYCPLCERSSEPKSGTQYLAHGSTSNRYIVKTCENNGRIGYTPHIYKAKMLNSEMHVEIACAMYKCGVTRRLEIDHWFYFVKPDSWIKEVWTIARWNSLVLYKHDNDYEV